MLPPDQRRHALFSETRMSGAKQPAFCGALARALLIGVDKTCNGQYCPELNAGFLPLNSCLCFAQQYDKIPAKHGKGLVAPK